jgi:succinylglutamate desuccinylase
MASGELVAFERTDTPGVWMTPERGSSGKVVGIIGGVHGNEPAGKKKVAELLQTGIEIDDGQAVLILANMVACEKNVRQTQPDANLNRLFRELTAEEAQQDPETWPSELRRSRVLLPWVDFCLDGIYDMHEFTDPAPAFTITEPRGFDTAIAIGSKLISFGWSKTEPGGTDGRAEEKGTVGLCDELGMRRHYRSNVLRASIAIERFMGARGLTEPRPLPAGSTHQLPKFVEVVTSVKAGDNYQLLSRESPIKNFDSLLPGEPIAVHNDGEVIYAPDEPGWCGLFVETNPPAGTEAMTFARYWTYEEAMALRPQQTTLSAV